MRGWKKFSRCSLALSFLLTTAAAQAEPAMWAIKTKHTTIYLFGTFHLLRAETIWDVPKIKKAAARSTELWLEVPLDLKDTSVMDLMGRYGFDHAKSLAEKLTPEQHERLEKAAARYTFPMELIDQMQPWYAGMMLEMLPLMKAGYNPMAGVEVLLQMDARIRHHKVRGFETMEEQIKLLSNASESDQIDQLMQMLDGVEKGIPEVENLEKAWSEGDLKSLEGPLVSEIKNKAPETYQHLIVERNKNWAGQIAQMLRGSGVKFVAVGTLHLVGPDSLQVQLAKRGIKVSRY